jgi:hypothetical protein
MRLWSLHPRTLDPSGLVALWREGLLARAVLSGKTTGYKNHPQLSRFKSQKNPVSAIDVYLQGVYEEARARGYSFDKSKIGLTARNPKISVSRGQLDYEFRHLMKKLKKRDPERYRELSFGMKIAPHPLFKIVDGAVESWEKILKR